MIEKEIHMHTNEEEKHQHPTYVFFSMMNY